MVVFAIGLFAVPQAFADVTIENAPGSASATDCGADCFIPNPVTIEVGDTVTWANTDTAAHTATSGTPADSANGLSGGVFDSGLVMAGQSYSFTFDTAGMYDYHCMVHPWMEGTVFVGNEAYDAFVAAQAAAEAEAEAQAAAEAEAQAAAQAQAQADAAAAAEALAVELENIWREDYPGVVLNMPGSSTTGCEPYCFLPRTVTIEAGDTVTWINEDYAAHTATSGTPADGPSGVFDSSLIMARHSYNHTFYSTGTYDYYCTVHPWMLGTVIVEGTSVPADIVPPTVLVPDDITLQAEDQNGASVTFNPQAIDNIDELITPTCSHASGSVFPIGTTTVTCTATDSSGNTATGSFNVIIEYTGSLIPSWVKNVAGFWNDGSINDASFLEGISYLIQNDIIIVPTTESGSGGGEVPDWVKNTAGWWANDEIDDDTFVNAITYLIQQGLIQV